MLYGCANSVFLHASDNCCRRFSGKQRILRIILEISSAKRISVYIKSRCKKNIYIMFNALISENISCFFLNDFVPCAGKKRCARQCGCRNCRSDSGRTVGGLRIRNTKLGRISDTASSAYKCRRLRLCQIYQCFIGQTFNKFFK